MSNKTNSLRFHWAGILLVFVKECEECENRVLIQVKAFDGFVWDVVGAGGFGEGYVL